MQKKILFFDLFLLLKQTFFKNLFTIKNFFMLGCDLAMPYVGNASIRVGNIRPARMRKTQ